MNQRQVDMADSGLFWSDSYKKLLELKNATTANTSTQFFTIFFQIGCLCRKEAKGKEGGGVKFKK